MSAEHGQIQQRRLRVKEEELSSFDIANFQDPSMLVEGEFSFRPFAESQEYVEVNSYFLNKAFDELFRKIPVDKAIRILDNCGSDGNNAESILKIIESTGRKAKITVLDMDNDALTRGKNRIKNTDNVKVDFIHGNATNLPFQEETFDCVFFLNALHEIPGKENKEKALSESSRVTKEKGNQFVSSAFTGEMFPSKRDFVDWGRLRKAAFSLLGKQNNKIADPFEVYKTLEYCEMMNENGWKIDQENNTESKTQALTSNALRAISNDKPFLQGSFMDMEDADVINYDLKRKAMIKAINQAEDEERRVSDNPEAKYIHNRNFVFFSATKTV